MTSLIANAALITGAAQGIGKAFADHLLAENVKVMIVDINKTVGEETRKELAKKYGEDKVSFVHCDVTKEEQLEDAVKETIRKLGNMDLLINNAGILNEREHAGLKTIAVNFNGTVFGTILGLKYMGKHKGHNGGTIVNIASTSTFSPYRYCTIYSATKSAVNQLSRSLGETENYNITGVRVICISPGATITSIAPNLSDVLRPELLEGAASLFQTYIFQSADNMGKGLIEILRKAESGTMWVVQDNKPPKRIDFILKIYEEEE